MSPRVFTRVEMEDPVIQRGVALSEVASLMTSDIRMVALITRESTVNLSCEQPGDPLFDFMRDLEGYAEAQAVLLPTSRWLALLIESLPESVCDVTQLAHESALIRGLSFSETHYTK